MENKGEWKSGRKFKTLAPYPDEFQYTESEGLSHWASSQEES